MDGSHEKLPGDNFCVWQERVFERGHYCDIIRVNGKRANGSFIPRTEITKYIRELLERDGNKVNPSPYVEKVMNT